MRTLYRLIPTKAALFKAVVADSVDGFMLAIDEQVLATLGLEAALERILAEFGRLTLSEETSHQSAGDRRMRAVSGDRRRVLRDRHS